MKIIPMTTDKFGGEQPCEPGREPDSFVIMDGEEHLGSYWSQESAEKALADLGVLDYPRVTIAVLDAPEPAITTAQAVAIEHVEDTGDNDELGALLALEGGHAIAPVKPGAQTEMFTNYF